MTAFSDMLRAAKNGKKWSNRRLAKEAGLAPATVDAYMREIHGTPDEPTIAAFHEALGIPLAELRRAAAVPVGEAPPYAPPQEANRLSQRQRLAIDELIRSMVIARENPFDTTTRLLNYLEPLQLREIAEKAVELADELDDDRERAYAEPTTHADREAFMEGMGFSHYDSDWWMDDVDALARTWAAIAHEWGFVEQEFLEALREMPYPRERPTPESHYRAFYEQLRDYLDARRHPYAIAARHEDDPKEDPDTE